MYFEYKLPEIFENLTENLAENNEEQENFIEKVMKLLIVWNDWVIFETKFLTGLEVLLYKKSSKFSNFETSTQLGIKMKCLEEDLKGQTMNSLEKACKINGLPMDGPKNKLIERLMILEEYKFNEKNMKKEPEKQENKKKESLKKIDGFEKNEKNEKNSLSLMKTFRNIYNKKLNEKSLEEIDSYCKTYLEVLRLMQSRAEKFNISDVEGLEFDELDEYVFDIKRKIGNLEENIDGFFFSFQ